MPSQETENNGVERITSSRRQNGYERDVAYHPRAPQAQISRSQTVSYRRYPAPTAHGHHRSSNSFSARSRNVPPNWDDKPLPPEPETTEDEYTTPSRRPLPQPAVPQDESAREASPQTILSTQPTSPLSRSDTTRSTKERRHDWASDRSPLQKLEVALDGISKEEKRARVMEAEMKVKERLERQKAESEARDSPAPAPAPASAKESASPAPALETPKPKAETPQMNLDRSTRSTTRSINSSLGTNTPDGYRDSPEERHIQRSNTTREPSSFRYAAVPRNDMRYVKPSAGQPVPAGQAPRRAVSVSHHPGRPMPRPLVNGKSPQEIPIIHKRTVSQADPVSVPPRRVMLDENQAPRQASIPVPRDLPGRPAKQRAPSAAMPNSRRPSAGAYLAQNAVVPEPVQPVARDPAVPQDLPSHESNECTAPPKPKRNTVSFNVPPPTPPPLFEWKNAPVARLDLSDFEFQNLDVARIKAWWGEGASNRRRSRGLPKNYQMPSQKPKSYKTFQPSLHLRSGPLLRYTGMKRVQIDGPNGPFEKVTWRGSIMIVTQDSKSVYEPAPTLRLFSQPMDLLPPPPVLVNGDDEGSQLPPEYVDPTAGLMKLGRDGRPLYVKPVEHTEEELDLSHVEDDDGIYELSASILDFSSEGVKQPMPANRVHSVDGEVAGAYKELTGIRLYADPDRDVTFWRFNIEVELREAQQRIAYRINYGPALGFWVPAKSQMMNMTFHSGNGFTPGVDTNKFCGPDPLWRDILNEHQTRPFHVMIGGGDQIFNDKVTAESIHFQDWLKIKDLGDQYNMPFDPEFRAELESSFLENYLTWFSQGLFSLVGSQIPMVNMWNDHEILEGYGSYPDEFMQSPVISGLGRIAFKYYLLFQHQTAIEETDHDEPSWIMGAEPGPYIRERSRSLFIPLGKGVTLLGLDERTERMSHEILSEPTCDIIWDRCHREMNRGEVKHLLVLSSIPIAYPRMAMLKNILNSRKSLGKAGLFGGLVNKNGGKIEIYDDHWTAKHHKAERTFLIEDLQDLAADKSIRITILSGDVHLAAMGQFYSNPKLGLPKDKDYRYMPNIISSAIANSPETEMVSDMLNRRNQVHHMDSNTDEDMIPIFTHDVDGKPRNNKRLIPRRNWCSIREYQPGFTPPATPDIDDDEEEPRPGKLKRTLSLTRGDRPAGGLLRRLSGRGRPPTKDIDFDNLGNRKASRRMSMDGPFPPSSDSSLPPPRSTESFNRPGTKAGTGPGSFFRRPTNPSRRGSIRSKKSTTSNTNSTTNTTTGDDDGMGGLVNLEGGLAITLNLELNPKDPAGITTPYKLLVPMLRYDGVEYDPPATRVTKGWKKWLGVKKGGDLSQENNRNGEETEGDEVESDGENYDNGDQHGQAEDYSDSDADVGAGSASEEERRKRKKWFGRNL